MQLLQHQLLMHVGCWVLLHHSLLLLPPVLLPLLSAMAAWGLSDHLPAGCLGIYLVPALGPGCPTPSLAAPAVAAWCHAAPAAAESGLSPVSSTNQHVSVEQGIPPGTQLRSQGCQQLHQLQPVKARAQQLKPMCPGTPTARGGSGRSNSTSKTPGYPTHMLSALVIA